MKRTSLVSPGSLNRLVQAATEAWKRCDFPVAIETLERASRLNPSNPAILLELGRWHGLRYNYAAAERCLDQAVRVSPRKTEALALAGANGRDFRNPELTERYWRRAAEQNDVPTEILADLADLFIRLRRKTEAGELIDRALRLNAGSAAALVIKARLEAQGGELEAAERTLRSLPASTSPAVRIRAAYDLGQVLDRQGRYDEAMAAFLEAKSLQRPQAERPAAELKIIRARIRHVIQNTTAERLKVWQDSAGSQQPVQRLTLLGGHPRSGTTLLEQVLDSHPAIVSAEETEIFYNDAYAPLLHGHADDTAMFTGLDRATPEQLKKSRQNYFQAMDLILGSPVAGRLLLDKNPSYTFLLPAFIRIFPEAKLLIALRDPRDVVLSCFMQHMPMNHSGAAFLTLDSTVTEYVELMNVWLNLKPIIQNPWLEIRYEDMVEDLAGVARRTLEFLELPWDEQVLGYHQHARNKLVHSPTYADVTQPVYKRALGRWHNYEKHLEPHLANLEPFVIAFGYES